jgi:hypothetical protein
MYSYIRIHAIAMHELSDNIWTEKVSLRPSLIWTELQSARLLAIIDGRLCFSYQDGLPFIFFELDRHSKYPQRFSRNHPLLFSKSLHFY